VTVAAIYLSDRLMQSERSWVLSAHARAAPLFESKEIGVEFRMADQWFTVQYDCGTAASIDGFFIRAYEDGVRTDYDFKLRDRHIYANGNKCFYAQAKADRPYRRIEFGAMSKRAVVWEREARMAIVSERVR
jgi:hypothetical protein